MTLEKSLMVTIDSTQRIPFINKRGPIVRPIALTEQVVNDLRKLGYRVTVHSTENVGIDHQGNRYIVNPADFVAAEQGEPVVITNEETPEPFANPLEDLVPQEPTEHTVVEPTEHTVVEPIVETPVEITEEVVVETEESPVVEETEEELDLLSLEEYSKWSIKRLRTLVTVDLKDYVSEEDIALVTESKEKDEVLAVIAKVIGEE